MIAIKPILIAGGAVAAAGTGLYFVFKKKAPVLQSVRRVTVNGIPVQVVVPVAGQPTPVMGVGVVPLGPNASSGASYAPAPIIKVNDPGQLALAPTVITPTGASSLTIVTTQDLQNALNTLNFGPLKVDGIAGPETSTAIKAFQSKSGLAVDGVVGPNTKSQLQDALSALAGAAAAVAASASQTASGFAVTSAPKSYQHALNLLGASPMLVEDGATGARTLAAIKAFQIAHGLTADGVVGPMTLSTLNAALNPGGATSNVSGEMSFTAGEGIGGQRMAPFA